MNRLILISLLILFASCQPGSRELQWQQEDGYRWAEVELGYFGSTGFQKLSPSETNVAFETHLTDQKIAENQMLLHGSGVAAADVDGDGLTDLYFAQLNGPNKLYRNTGNFQFEDITDRAGVAHEGVYSTGVLFADIDGDGDPDLLVNTMDGPMGVYLNDGSGAFNRVENSGLGSGNGGSTLPRGWYRTYPNLVTMESVKGFEFVTFEQVNADRQAMNSAILPFTRNVFDPMDYTPVVFGDIPGPVDRVTTNGFELALAVLFQSGVQHYAVLPETMAEVPDYVRSIMSEIPASWDETRFVAGYPGEWVVLARRTGDTWFVAGINGTGQPIEKEIQLPFINAGEGMLVSEGDEPRSFARQEIAITSGQGITIQMARNGGFLIKADE